MIVHVWRRALEAGIGPVAVATDAPAIAEAIAAVGGIAVMTRDDHASGSDRIFEAVEKLDPEGRHDVVVNVQGDLPTIDPAAVAASIVPLADREVDIATLVAIIEREEEKTNPNVVKMVGSPDRARPLPRALFHPGDGALRRRTALSSHRPLRLSPQGAAAFRRPQTLAAGDAREARAAAGARGRHAHRCGAGRRRAPRRRYSPRSGQGARHHRGKGIGPKSGFHFWERSDAPSLNSASFRA